MKRPAYAYRIISKSVESEPGLLKSPSVTHFLPDGCSGARDEPRGTANNKGSGSCMGRPWPPDAQHRLAMLGLYVLLMVVIREPELSEELKEFDISAVIYIR